MLPDEVRKAVERAELMGGPGDEWMTIPVQDWQTIRAHLLARETEVEMLRAPFSDEDATAGSHWFGEWVTWKRRCERAEANLEAANKAVDTYREMLVSIIKVVRERDDRQLQAHIDATGITAHLSENSRG